MMLRPEKTVPHEWWIGIIFFLIVKINNFIEPDIRE
jgi:hypothetical protein